jgi:hypothetical protein
MGTKTAVVGGLVSIALVCAGANACSSTNGAGSDAGAAADAGENADASTADGAAVVCPPEPPALGAACTRLGMKCTYRIGDAGFEQTYACGENGWAGQR